MRYRARRDFILNDPEGNKTFVAQGDKVFVQQHSTQMWEIYSFYSRSLMAIINQDSLVDLFGLEEEFQKLPRDDRFKGRNFGRRQGSSGLMILLLLLSFMGKAQVNPITWSWKAVRVDPTHFEFQIRADIARGWWIYAPNRQDECPFSPLVTFERSSVMKPVEKVVVLEYLIYASNEGTEGVYPSFCPIPQYRSSVVFMQLFKMPIDSSGTVRGQITFQAMSKYMATPSMAVDFELHVGAELRAVKLACGDGSVIITYPKGIFRKTWWFIRHPFGPQYIKRSFYP